MSTLVSGTSPYCSGAQFLVRYDVRTAAELLVDTNASMDVTQVAASATLNTLLMASSGKFEAAALKGGKYTLLDLQLLTAPTSNMREWIAEIIADLTAPKVLGRRWLEFPDYKDRLKEANDVLEALADGDTIFGLQEVIDAGVINSEVETPDIVEQRNMITLQASPYFGTRANRRTLGPHLRED
jgi:hypothetical protein